jgi:hypothetical protein
MRYLISLVSISLCLNINSQVINPRIWYVGYQTDLKKDTNTPDTQFDIIQHGSTILNFKNSPIGISRFGYALSHGACNVQLFDKKDSLILYSNGSKIFNGKHRLVEGGDSLSFGIDWKNGLFAGNYYGEYLISAYPNAMIAIPSVKNANQYYFISTFISRDYNLFPKLVYTLVDMNLNGGRGKVIEKEVLIKNGEFAPAIEACKHGNGRDWWIITREYGKKNFIIMLLDSTGIKVVSEPALSDWSLADWGAIKGNTTNRFSWDGTMFASFTHLGIELFDFNRCNGTLFNRRGIAIPSNDSFHNGGGVGGFSPNSKFIYTGDIHYYYQVDIFNSSKIRKIATYDGFRDTPTGQTGGIETVFGSVQLAADGKLYMNTMSTTRYLHSIENPNDTGIFCNFKQHSVRLLTYNNGLPHYPNYELGAVANKCGESGITDNEIAKIEVYPNPVSEFLVVSGQKLEGISIEIYNLLGQKMSPSIEAKNQGYRLGVQALPEGIYLLQVSDKNHNLIKTERLVITR